MSTWQDVAKGIAAYAPQVASLLALTGVGAPVAAAVGTAGALVSAALGTPNDAGAVAAAIQSPEAAVKLKEIEANSGTQMAQLAAQVHMAELSAQTEALKAVNATMQKEDETRKFSWRDLWGWISGIAFGFCVALIGYLVVNAVVYNHPEYLATIPSIVGAFSVMFGISATVLGVQSAIETHHAGMADRIAAAQP